MELGKEIDLYNVNVPLDSRDERLAANRGTSVMTTVDHTSQYSSLYGARADLRDSGSVSGAGDSIFVYCSGPLGVTYLCLLYSPRRGDRGCFFRVSLRAYCQGTWTI